MVQRSGSRQIEQYVPSEIGLGICHIIGSYVQSDPIYRRSCDSASHHSPVGPRVRCLLGPPERPHRPRPTQATLVDLAAVSAYRLRPGLPSWKLPRVMRRVGSRSLCSAADARPRARPVPTAADRWPADRPGSRTRSNGGVSPIWPAMSSMAVAGTTRQVEDRPGVEGRRTPDGPNDPTKDGAHRPHTPYR